MVGAVTIPAFTFVYHAHVGLATKRNSCLTSYILSHCPTAVSLLTLLVIAIERFIAIHCPFSYHNIFTKRKTGFFVAVIWLYTWILLPALLFSTNHWYPDLKDCNFTDISSEAYIAIMCAHLLLVFVITAALHGAVAYTAWKHRCQIRIQARLVNANTSVQQDAKTARMLALVLGIFYLCWLPYFLTLPFALWGMEDKEPFWFHVWEQFSGIVLISNSFMNPIVYAWKDRDLRHGFKKVLRKQSQSGYESVLMERDKSSTESTKSSKLNMYKASQL